MNEIFLAVDTRHSFDKMDLENKIRDAVWAKYEKLKKNDYFKITVLKFIKVDISGKVEELLTRWFGENPYTQTTFRS